MPHNLKTDCTATLRNSSSQKICFWNDQRITIFHTPLPVLWGMYVGTWDIDTFESQNQNTFPDCFREEVGHHLFCSERFRINCPRRNMFSGLVKTKLNVLVLTKSFWHMTVTPLDGSKVVFLDSGGHFISAQFFDDSWDLQKRFNLFWDSHILRFYRSHRVSLLKFRTIMNGSRPIHDKKYSLRYSTRYWFPTLVSDCLHKKLITFPGL